MTPGHSNSEPIFVATCKVCGTRIDELAERHPKQVPCPDCFTMATIPSLNEVNQLAGTAEEEAQALHPDIYRLVLQPMEDDGNGAVAKRNLREFLVVCPICTARLHVEPRSEAGQLKCPDCLEFIRVPSLAEAQAQRAKQAIPKPQLPVQALSVPAAPKQKRLKTEFDKARAEIRRVESDPPPRWVFFSNVFDFPWSEGVMSRWIYLSVGLTAISVVCAGILHILANGSGYLLMAIAFFALPLIWIFIWTYSYATSIWITILEDTASGNQRIYNWLQQNWREWVIEACRFTLILGYAMTMAHCVGYAARMAGGDYVSVAFDTLFIVFPVMMLSAMHAGSVFSPVTFPIVRSLYKAWRAWLLYYLLSGAVLIGWGVLWSVGMSFSPIVVSVLGGPVWAAVWLIWARLLGRLGWAITLKEQDGEPATRKRRRPKPAVAE